ncbi:lysylphosphatidylglycerol synthase transmembrane domain-containing protein [Novosphingobium terrae]|uniref:lysylphosphatidylglycerol synthase transmembrane domain-containing protein n=1 Tax=Novosphingobium terrae TaxID=2726189 RepID=UPI001F13A229|nr:lysylphosphatidylglycerol synthase transmembrane domain-containing protein [Novosphingobium terrae]
MDAEPARPRHVPKAGAGRWRGWFFGIMLVGALVAAVLRRHEIARLLVLVSKASPDWLAAALGLQILTYVCLALGWQAVLRHAGHPQPMPRLLRIAITKLFADQALPSAGLGGNVVLVDQLMLNGVPRGASVAALILSMIGFYAAYAVFAVAMLMLLWLHGAITPWITGLVSLFLLVAMAIPGTALWLRQRGRRPLPRWMAKLGFVRDLLVTVGEAPGTLLRDRPLIAQVTFWNALIFLLDAATLLACLRALGQGAAGQNAGLWAELVTAYIAFMMASIVITLGPVPLGLGSFEATCTLMLSLMGVPSGTGLTATLLLRVLTLWLPLLPGLLLMRGAIAPHQDG